MKKRVGLVLAMVLTMSLGISAFATDIESMSLDELKEAYAQLESEKAELEEQVKDLKVQLFDLQTGAETLDTDTSIENADAEEATEETEEAVLMSTEDFLNDIYESYETRSRATERYTSAELNTMTNDEMVEAYNTFCEAERPFYEKYKNAIFDDLNIQYLCNQYITGLKKQYESYTTYQSNKDFDEHTSIWQSGYYNRGYVIVELSEYYNVPFGDVSDMKEDTASMDSLNEAETRNAGVDHETVRKTQELLNGIGFFCGNADGVSGKRTVKSIKRFQEMYGYDPIDGIIDDELIGQLQTVYDEKNPSETVAEEETE